MSDMKGIFDKNRNLIVTILGLLLIVYVTSQGWLVISTLQPGFEGPKCYFYGADFRFEPEWEGTYMIHRYQDAEDPLVYNEYVHLGGWKDFDRIYWATVATPNDGAIGYRFKHDGVLTPEREYPFLGVHVESNIALEDITRQGDPLHWNDTHPDSARRIEYWTTNIVKEETSDKVLYHYTYEKESFYLSPAEFWVGFYLVPSQADAQTGSGWREGEWSSIVVWFMLDWNTWDNAYNDPWLDDPQENVFDSTYDGVIANKQRSFDYRGGFPIAGWIQGWEKAGSTSNSDEEQESPLWLETRGTEDDTYTIEELADLKDKLMAKVQFSPGLVGQFISLYDEASDSFEYENSAGLYQSTSFPDTNETNEDLASYVKAPDSRMKKTMFFPINIMNFGTYVDPTDYILGVPTGWRVFYPSCYFRIRMIYGVYGSFTYLWTEEVKKDPTINYPEEIERHGTTVIHVRGPGAEIGAWWWSIATNPWTIFWVLIIIVILAIVFIGGSGIAGTIFKRRRGG